MTSHNNDISETTETAADPAPLDERRVADYLRRHPDFFQDKPSLLGDLRVPHDAGGAVSLVERQILVLRENAERQQKQLDNLIRIAHDNSRLSEQMHELTLAIMRCRTLESLLTLLEDTLLHEFSADAVALRLLARAVAGEQPSADVLVVDKEHFYPLFKRLLHAGKPYCGRLKTDQLAVLFPEQVGQAGSTAVLPLGQQGRFGLLSIFSYDRGRFTATADTAFLGRLADIIAVALLPYLQSPRQQLE